jgi:hypothetical protein
MQIIMGFILLYSLVVPNFKRFKSLSNFCFESPAKIIEETQVYLSNSLKKHLYEKSKIIHNKCIKIAYESGISGRIQC